MQNSHTQKRIKSWSVSRVAAVIGILLLLGIASYMAYDAIDIQARSSLAS